MSSEPKHSTPLTWADVLNESSRVHTTRTREVFGEKREDSRVMEVWIHADEQERPAVVVPTRMHEPGFYLRWEDEWLTKDDRGRGLNIVRDEMGLAGFRVLVESGKVRRRG